MQKIIKCSHIFCDHESDPISGYIIIENEKIKKIIKVDSQNGCEFKQNEVIDLEDSYIIPGLIDLNVHLNSNYDEDWNDIENISKMAAQGGITTIIDNPLMNNYNSEFDEFEALKQRRKKLVGNLYVDCGLMALLSSHNYHLIEALWNSNMILGFKIYLSLSLQHDIPQIDTAKRHLKKIADFLYKTSLSDIFISIHPELASNRDFFMCSPLRGLQKEKRLDLEEEIKDSDKFGGAIHGEMDNAEDSNKDSSSEENEKEDLVDELKVLEKDVRNSEDNITSGTLKIRSINAAQIQDQKAIHLLEMMGYSLNEEEFEDIKEIENSDSELNKTKNSSDEESEEDEKQNFQGFTLSNKKSVFSKRPENFENPSIKPQFELNKLFKDKLRTAINNVENDKPQTKEASFKDFVLMTKQSSELKISFRNSEHLEQDKTEITNKIEVETKIKRPSSLLMRRSSSRNVSSKSVDLALSPSNKMKEDLNKLKTSVQNSSYNFFLLNHYVSWEINGTKQILNHFKNSTNLKVLISNISSPSAAFLVRNERKKNPKLSIFCETSVPYLYFHSTMIKKGECKYKGSPPIRDKENRNLLILGLNVENLIHCVSSFHLEIPQIYKNIEKGNFKRSINGFSIIGFNLQVLWTKLYVSGKKKFAKHSNELLQIESINNYIKTIIRLMCTTPANLLNLENKKGKIKEGYDADFVVWNPFKIEEITDDMIYLRYKKLFLLRNYKLYGKVIQTYLRGKCIFYDNLKNKKNFEKFGEVIIKNPNK